MTNFATKNTDEKNQEARNPSFAFSPKF